MYTFYRSALDLAANKHGIRKVVDKTEPSVLISTVELKVFDPPAFLQQRQEHIHFATELEIAGMREVLSLLGWEPKELWESAPKAA